MKIVIKTKNLKLNQALEEFIEEKIDSLEKFSKIFYNEEYFDSFFGSPAQISEKFVAGKGKPRIEAWVEVGKESLHHQKPERSEGAEMKHQLQRQGPWFYVECQIRFPKRSLRSVARRKDLKLAITEVKDELQRQLKQYKEKFRAETKRGARVLKKELKISPLARLNFEKNFGGQARFYRKGRIREEGI